MNGHIVALVNKIQGVGTQAEKVKAIEAYVNSEKQRSYFQAKAKIISTLKKQTDGYPHTPLSVAGVIGLINDI